LTLTAKATDSMDLPTVATFLSGTSFLVYGTSCLTSAHMKNEFIRFGYGRQRPLIGYLQLLGGLGLLIGYWLAPALALFSAVGLALMMAFGFGVRMKIRDSFVAASPALFYAALNLYLSLQYYAVVTHP
jgi:uncharacterized membrane protein YphA (DoxX/SURF4 family)